MFKIKPLDNQQSENHSTVPTLPFSAYLVAQKGGGKSTTLLNMLVNKNILANKFNQIYYISPTALLDSKTEILKNTSNLVLVNKPLIKLLSQNKNKKVIMDINEDNILNYETKIPEENFIEDVSGDLLKNLIAQQKKIITRFGKKLADNILLVYDDCISAKKFWTSDSVLKMLLNSRHYKISIIITSQCYKLLPKSLRLNMSFLILFYTANHKELQAIYEENSSSLGWRTFESVFNDITELPYNFLTINYQATSKNRLQNAFENTITFN